MKFFNIMDSLAITCIKYKFSYKLYKMSVIRLLYTKWSILQNHSNFRN